MSEDLEKAIADAASSAAAEVGVVEEKSETEAVPVKEETVPVEDKPVEDKPAKERGSDGKFVSKAAEPKEESEEEEEPLGLTADDLAAINADAKLLKAYKSMQRGLTKKTTGLAETRKSLETRAAIADWIQNDPDAAIRAIAAARGVKLAEAVEGADSKKEAQKEVVDALETEWNRHSERKARLLSTSYAHCSRRLPLRSFRIFSRRKSSPYVSVPRCSAKQPVSEALLLRLGNSGQRWLRKATNGLMIFRLKWPS